MPACHRSRVVILVAIACLWCAPLSWCQVAAKVSSKPQAAAAPPAETPKSPPAPDPNQPIALPDIADRAEELDLLLHDIGKELVPLPELLTAAATIKETAPGIAQRGQQLDPFLIGALSPLELQEEDRYWRSLSEQYSSYRKLLTTRAAKLEEQVRLLEQKNIQWQATLAQIQTNKGIETVVERVNRALQDIGQCRAETQAELNRVLNLQTDVSQQEQVITEAMRKLGETRERLRGRVFERDGLPLWRSRELRSPSESLATVANRSADRGFMAAGEFLRIKWQRLAGIVFLYLVSLLLALRFKRDIAMGRFAEIPPEAARVFTRPYSVALLVALLGTVGQTIAAPPGVLFIVYVLYSIQMVRLTPLLTHPRVLPLLYALAAFCLLEGFYLVIQLSPLARREFFAAIVLSALVTFTSLTRSSAVRQWPVTERRVRMTVAAVRTGALLLALSLLANVLGFVSLSQIVGVATLLGAFSAILLYASVRVLALMLSLGLQSWARSLGERRKELEYWGGIVLALAGFGFWLNTVTYLFAIHDSVAEAVARLLKYPVGFGKVQILVGDILGSLLVILAGYALANVITFVIRELFLAKIRLARGLPHAISTIFYYLLLVLVGFIAVSELGVELNKLTLITGALGIGVGFGLQTTVSNFVSGLILLFERPIRVGDVVEVAGVVGAVRRIGVRSSTIHTFDDAEVIVPNNDLIANKVTNWTLSSPRRRVDVPVGIAYGTDPGRVLKLLVKVAAAVPGVLRQPEPVAFFLGFGDSTLNFELRFWSMQESWFQVKSDVTLSMAKALSDSGIEIPFPQRDLHLRSIDAETRSALQISPPKSAPAEVGKFAAGRGGRGK